MTAKPTAALWSGGSPPRLRLTLATKITLLRFLGIPVFVGVIVYYRLSLTAGAAAEGYRLAAFVVFLLIALTDALDGYVARSRGEITPLGAVLDPMADKLLLWSAIATLTAPAQAALRPQLPVWFALVVFSRDALLAIGAYILHHLTGTVEIRPTRVGKLATALQMACVIAVLAVFPTSTVVGLAAAAVAGTLISAVQYVRRGLHSLHVSTGCPSGSRENDPYSATDSRPD